MTEVGADGRVRVNCGLQHPISLPVPPEMAGIEEGERVTVRVSSRRPVRAKIEDVPPPGFVVDRADLDAALSRDDAGFAIATSRHGEVLTASRLGRLAGRLRAGDGRAYTVAFGAPERGLPAMLGLDPAAVGEGVGGFDRWLNTVPDQGSEVVHTEEAVCATLAVLNLTE